MNLTFLPWVRQGLAASLNAAAPAARPTVSVQVKLKQEGQTERTADVSAELFGPGDVLALDRSAIIRTWPAPNGQVTDDTLVAVELDRADLPWMFSPNAAAGPKLVPWLQLVVVSFREGVRFDERPGQNAVLRVEGASVVGAELPAPEDAWAFAHAQVAGVSVTDPAALAALVRDKPAQSSSRILAARKLEKGRRYRACLVPTYELGRRAGLGLPSDGAGTGFAWSAGATEVELPVYFHWELTCSEQGGFREQVEKLTPRKLSGAVGRRVAFAAPGPGLETGFAFELPGVLRALDAPAVPLPPAEAQRFASAVDSLHAKPRTLVPARYGDGHAPKAPWVERINHDPSLRAAAALGTQVVQRQQEALVAAVWEQLERPAPTMAEAAKHVNRALARRFFGAQEQPTAAPEIVARMTAFASNKAVAGMERSRAVLAASTVALPAVRRLASIAGRDSLVQKTRLVALRARVAPPPPGISTFKSGGPVMPTPLAISPETVEKWPIALLFKRVDEQAPFPLGLAVVNAKVSVKVQRPPVGRPTGVVVRDHRRAAADVPPAPVTGRRGVVRDHRARTGPVDVRPELVEVPPAPAENTVVRDMNALRASVPWHFHQPQPQDDVDSVDAVAFRAAARAVHGWLAPFIKPLVIRGTVLQPLTFAVATLQPVAVKAMLDSVKSVLVSVLATPTTAPTAAPSPLGIRYPMWRTLLEQDPEAMLPHLDRVPMETVGLLGVNAAFVEAFLAGLNHELLREVRWRKIPVQGTPTFFDSVLTAEQEVPALEKWAREDNLSPALRDATVLLIRGELARNQPRLTMYAVREGQPQSVTAPAFEGSLDEATRFVGFPIPAAALRAADQRWRLVLEEQPTEPCFTAPKSANPGPLRAAAFGATSSAHLAQASLRRPFRVVIPAVDLVP